MVTKNLKYMIKTTLFFEQDFLKLNLEFNLQMQLLVDGE